MMANRLLPPGPNQAGDTPEAISQGQDATLGASASVGAGKQPVGAREPGREVLEAFAEAPRRQIDSPQFKAWFGASHVRQPMVSSRQRLEDMDPLVVYHGTLHSPEVFETGRKTVNDWGWLGLIECERSAIFFAESAEFASSYPGREQGANVMPVYLSIQKPFYMDQQSLSDYYGEMAAALDEARKGGIGPEWETAKANFNRAHTLYNLKDTWEVFDDEAGKEFVSWLQSQGYDGVFYQEDPAPRIDGDLQNVWVVFSPNQIKSATGNCGDFDPQNPDVRR
jgi:hypothetical protein